LLVAHHTNPKHKHLKDRNHSCTILKCKAGLKTDHHINAQLMLKETTYIHKLNHVFDELLLRFYFNGFALLKNKLSIFS